MCADVELEVEYRFEGVLFTLVKKTSTIPWSCQSFRLDSMSQWGWSLARTSCINSEWSITFGSINQNFRATNIPRSHMLLFLWLQHGMGTKWTFYTSAQNFLDIDTCSCSDFLTIGHQADSYRISLAAILWRYIGEGLSHSNFPPERNITQNFPATRTRIETACMFSRENLRELRCFCT